MLLTIVAMNRFQRKLHNHHVPLTRGPFETLQINIGWRGEVFDCDFNQMLRMQQRNGKPLFLDPIRKASDWPRGGADGA